MLRTEARQATARFFACETLRLVDGRGAELNMFSTHDMELQTACYVCCCRSELPSALALLAVEALYKKEVERIEKVRNECIE